MFSKTHRAITVGSKPDTVIPNRRFDERGTGFNPQAVARFTAIANDRSRSTPSQNQMWGANLSGKLDR